MVVLRKERVQITKAVIKKKWSERGKGQRLTVRDLVCPGLALVVNAGSMTWTYSYKPRGRDAATGRRFSTRSITIGSPETHSPEHARTEAHALKGRAKAGIDPAEQRRAKLAQAAKHRGTVVERLLKSYAEILPRRDKLRGAGKLKPETVRDELTAVRDAMNAAQFMARPVADITPADIRAVLVARGAQNKTARLWFAALSRFFDWCAEEGHVQSNPCAQVPRSRRPRTPAPRSHYLKPPELARLWMAAGTAPSLQAVYRDLMCFLICVPCRLDEARTIEWAHLDLAAAVWTQPGKVTKNGDPHRFFLHPLALELLRARHVAAGRPLSGLVFPAPRSGGLLHGLTDLKAKMDTASGLNGWRNHDMRRSFVSTLAEAGFNEAVLDAILNHRQAATRSGVLGVYQQAQRWPEQVAAMKAWGDLLAQAIRDAESSAGRDRLYRWGDEPRAGPSQPGSGAACMSEAPASPGREEADSTFWKAQLGIGAIDPALARSKAKLDGIMVKLPLDRSGLIRTLAEAADVLDDLFGGVSIDPATKEQVEISHRVSSTLSTLAEMLRDLDAGITDPILRAVGIGTPAAGHRVRETVLNALIGYRFLRSRGVAPAAAAAQAAEVVNRVGWRGHRGQPVTAKNVGSWARKGRPGVPRR